MNETGKRVLTSAYHDAKEALAMHNHNPLDAECMESIERAKRRVADLKEACIEAGVDPSAVNGSRAAAWEKIAYKGSRR